MICAIVGSQTNTLLRYSTALLAVQRLWSWAGCLLVSYTASLVELSSFIEATTLARWSQLYQRLQKNIFRDSNALR